MKDDDEGRVDLARQRVPAVRGPCGRPFERRGPGWCELGFQQEDPASDVRARAAPASKRPRFTPLCGRQHPSVAHGRSWGGWLHQWAVCRPAGC